MILCRWRLWIAVAFAMVTILFLPEEVRPDNGPHGDYGAITDKCAGCHRAHTAGASRLLILQQTALCQSCHGGLGASTNVMDGTYAGTQGLRGGGFDNALMDPSLSGSPSSGPVTSRHDVGSLGTAWGGGLAGSGVGTALVSPLLCTSCHDPHGSDSYRILRPVPLGASTTTGVPVPDESPIVYTISYTTDSYRNTNYASTQMSAWCAQCHTRYLAASGAGSTTLSGENTFMFRHRTDGMGLLCVRCHVAHGTAATVQGYAASLTWPGGATTPGGPTSRLLHVNNRGVCTQCHLSSGGQIGGGCTSCHGQPPQTGSHAAHMSSSNGPQLTTCDACHVYTEGTHKNGQMTFADGATSLGTTNVCNTCHSPGGSYDGVSNPTIGAKANWSAGVYTGSSLQSGKQNWCLGCHDSAPAVVNATTATNKAGDNSTYGYNVTGHGRGTSYPRMSWQATSDVGNPGASQTCTACHDRATQHINPGASAKRLKAGYQNESNANCSQCHPPGTQAVGGPQFYTNAADFGSSAHGGKLCSDCHDVHGAAGANAAMTKSNEENLCYSCHGSISHSGHALDASFGKNGKSYTLQCTSCHNIHVVTGRTTESNPNKSPVSLFTNNTAVFGASSSQKMSAYVGTGTYRTPSGDTLTASQLPAYPTFCLDCHGTAVAEFGTHGGISWGGDEAHGSNSANVPNGGGTCPNWFGCGMAQGWDGDDRTGADPWPVIPRGKGDQIFSRSVYNHEERIAGANFILSCTDCHSTHESGTKIRTTVNGSPGSTIWNTMCNACHWYYSDWHAGMSCGSASCHAGGNSRFSGSNPVPNSIHGMSSRTGAGGTRTFNPDLVLDLRFEGNLQDAGSFQLDSKWADLATGSFTTGKSGQSILLNGDQTVQVGTENANWSTDEGYHGTWKYTEMKFNTTLEAWIYPTADANSEYSIFTKHTGYADGGYAFVLKKKNGSLRAALNVQIDNNGVSQGGKAGVRGAYSSAAIPLNAWSHVAASFDTGGPSSDSGNPSVGRIRIYVNGVDVTTSDSFGDDVQPGAGETSMYAYSENSPWNQGICFESHWCASEFSVGGFVWQNGFVGRIDDARVWNVTKPASYFSSIDSGSSPSIAAAVAPSSNQITVSFSKPVYTTSGGTGALVPGDFVFTDLDNGRTITAVTHTAGSATAVLTVSSDFDASNDFGVDTVAAASNAIFDALGHAAPTTPVTITGSLCPDTASFQFGEAAGSGTVTDASGFLVGTVNDPAQTIPGDGYLHGDGVNNYVTFSSAGACLAASTRLTIEARVKPSVVDNGTSSTVARIFAKDGNRNYQFSTWRITTLPTWATYTPPAGVGSFAFWVYPVDSHGGDPWKPVLTDYRVCPIQANHWYQVRVAWDSSKVGGIPGDIYVDDQGTDGLGAGEGWSGYTNCTNSDQSLVPAAKRLSQGDQITPAADPFTIGVNTARNGLFFNGLIDWITVSKQ